MDFIGKLPKTSSGYDSILVIIDRFTKIAIVELIKEAISAPEVARLVINKIFRRFGMLTSIISDRDTRFTSHFWKEFFTILKTDLWMLTAYHP